MELVRRESKSKEIAEILRHEILSGRIRPGEKLAGELILAGRFGVGRQVIRSALKLLKEGNLIRSSQGCGVYVNDFIPENISLRRVRIGYFYWTRKDSPYPGGSFLEGYQTIIQDSREKNCDILLSFGNSVEALEEWMRDYQLDGLLLSGYVDDDLVRALNKAEILFLILGNYELSEPVNILEKEVFSSTKKALGVLMERYRFKRIAGIFDTMFGNGPKEVYAALRRVAEESGIPFDETLFFSDNDEKKSYSVMKYLLGKRSLGNDDLLYLTSHTFIGAARAVLEEKLSPEERPYLFLDTPKSQMPYMDLVNCFLYEENILAKHAVDAFLNLFYGRTHRPWRGKLEGATTVSWIQSHSGMRETGKSGRGKIRPDKGRPPVRNGSAGMARRKNGSAGRRGMEY